MPPKVPKPPKALKDPIIKGLPTSVDHLLFPVPKEVFPDKPNRRIPQHQAREAICAPDEQISVQYDASHDYEPHKGESHLLRLSRKAPDSQGLTKLTTRQFLVRPVEKDGVVTMHVQALGEKNGKIPEQLAWACDRLAHFSDMVPHPDMGHKIGPNGATLHYKRR